MQAFGKPLPRGHGSVESVCYGAVTARERSFNHRLSQQRLEFVIWMRENYAAVRFRVPDECQLGRNLTEFGVVHRRDNVGLS